MPADVLDAPADAPPEPRTKPQPARERAGWITRKPWPRGRTRISAPLGDDELVIHNRTLDTWVLAVGYHALNPIGPQCQIRERVVKSGMFTARPLVAPVGTEYLVAYLNPAIRKVVIRAEILDGVPVYHLQLVEDKGG